MITSAAKVYDPRPRADYTVIGTTDSLCPECMDVVPAKIITRGRRVYFRKRCPKCGLREDFVCSDVTWWDRPEGQTPSVLPLTRSTSVRKGCPHDCGLCEDHEQHTCIGLVELTDRCNLSCPMCFASSGPAGHDHPLDDVIASLDRLVECEGRAEVCQLSGGEPTIHPKFRVIVDEALQRPIDYVMVNTNGIRLAKDSDLVEFLAARKDRVEIYLQWDGEDDGVYERLRGEPLLEIKQRALSKLQEVGLHVTLVATLTSPLPKDFYEDLWDTARRFDCVTGLSLQPATFCGRHLSPDALEGRITFPDVIEGLSRAQGSPVQTEDFAPLPCAHPNCHQILLAVRQDEDFVPISRFGPIADNLDLIAGGISFTPERSKELMDVFLARNVHCGSDCGCHDVVSIGSSSPSPTTHEQRVFEQFAAKVMSGRATAKDLLRITITSFLDAYNFDVRQLMKCCTHHVLPSGHMVPFCAYNTLYRPGHLKLPPIEPGS
ncbi:MAG: radical SAM protein [Planctomycetota bacterium]